MKANHVFRLHCSSCGVVSNDAPTRQCPYCTQFTTSVLNEEGTIVSAPIQQVSPLGIGLKSNVVEMPDVKTPALPMPAPFTKAEAPIASLQPAGVTSDKKEDKPAGKPTLTDIRDKVEALPRCNVTAVECGLPATCHKQLGDKDTLACDKHAVLLGESPYYFPNARDIRMMRGSLEAREGKPYAPRPKKIEKLSDTIYADVVSGQIYVKDSPESTTDKVKRLQLENPTKAIFNVGDVILSEQNSIANPKAT